jgi:uncharacterized protein
VSARRRRRARVGVAIVVLAKHPVAGRVKTRLAAAVGDEAACALYRAFVLDLAARLRRTRLPVWWAFTPASAPFARLVGSRRCFPQRPGDLGRRIAHAVRTVEGRGAGAVLALGADAPHVSIRELARAARALERGVDVVLGPAADGGYYLVGTRAPVRSALFAGIPWSTARVLATTRRRCRALGLTSVEVASDFDVDGPRDLARLRRLVGARDLRATRAAFRALDRTASAAPQSPKRIASA